MPTTRPQLATAAAELPIWMAALLASAVGREVRWDWIAGRAVHTNRRAKPVVIELLGVRVERGESVVVTWHPGETEYTVRLVARHSLAT